MAGQVDGKIALVTGGGVGYWGGLRHWRLPARGRRSLFSDVVVEGGEETVNLITSAGGEAVFVQTDVAQAAEVEALVTRAVERYGRLDCAFNNAGIAGAAARTGDYTSKRLGTG